MALPRLREVVYLTYQQYLEIKTNGSITVDGVTHYWDENAFYVTNQEGTAPTTNDYTDLDNKPILDTNNAEELPTVQSETLNGIIKLHKISKTGKSTDLVDSNTLVRFSNVSSTPQANMLVRYDSNGYLIANVVESEDGDNLISIINSKIIVGEMTCELAIQGSATRPKYNSVDLALYSDIPSFAISNTTGGVANAVVLDWTNNVLSAQLNSDIASRIQKALVLPMSAPAKTELVAVDNAGGQAMVDVGDNLIIENDTLKADLSSCAKNADFSKDTATQFGNYVVEKKKILAQNNFGLSFPITLSEPVVSGDILEIRASYYTYRLMISSFPTLIDTSAIQSIEGQDFGYNMSLFRGRIKLSADGTQITSDTALLYWLNVPNSGNVTVDSTDAAINKVYEVSKIIQ